MGAHLQQRLCAQHLWKGVRHTNTQAPTAQPRAVVPAVECLSKTLRRKLAPHASFTPSPGGRPAAKQRWVLDYLVRRHFITIMPMASDSALDRYIFLFATLAGDT
jgi:hypothetical protein